MQDHDQVDGPAAEGAADGQPDEAAAEQQPAELPTSPRPRSGETMRSMLLMHKAQQRTPMAVGVFDSSGQLKPLNSKLSTLMTEQSHADAFSSAPAADRRASANDGGAPLTAVCHPLPRIPGRQRDESMHRSGLLARPSLRSTAPPWWEMPPKVCLEADAFDHRHRSRVRSAEVLMRSLTTDSTSLGKAANFDKALREVRWNRFQLDNAGDGADALADAAAAAAAKRAAAAAAAAAAANGDGTGDGAEEGPWNLNSSIWGPRRKWCDARDFFDTGSVRRRMFDCDWDRALTHSNFYNFILRHDDDREADGDGDGRPDEIDEVRDVLWEHYELLTMVFDYYAARGSSRDPFSISQNEFNLFVTQCRLAVAGSVSCQPAHLDQLFLEANADGGPNRGQAEKYNAARALNRREFLQCVVRIAVARYVMTGRWAAAQSSHLPPRTRALSPPMPAQLPAVRWTPTHPAPQLRESPIDRPHSHPAIFHHTPSVAASNPTPTQVALIHAPLRLARHPPPPPFPRHSCPDVSDAIRTLCAADIDQHVDPGALQDSNAFRARYCYTPEVSAALSRHEGSLRALFSAYAGAEDSDSASSVGSLGSTELLSHEELQRLCADLAVFTPTFTRREATLAFVWSRMRYVDEMDDASRTKMVHLSFEDFLEFVTRLAAVAPLPTDDEIRQGGFEDAGQLILDLRFGDPRAYDAFIRSRAGRWDEPPTQPMERCVEHLLFVLIRTVEASAGNANGDGRLSSREAGSFYQEGTYRDGNAAAATAAAACKRRGDSAVGSAASGVGFKQGGTSARSHLSTPTGNSPRQHGAGGRLSTPKHLHHVAAARA
eukprot:scaffold9933_cov125-Isochrysis_galbana.AAC.4